MENEFTHIVREKTDEDLLTMIYQFEQWDPAMLKAVEQELQHRNILPEDVGRRKKELIDAEYEILSEGKEASAFGQLVGWVGIFGILGFIMGYRYSTSKTSSKYTGEEFYIYDESSRQQGKYMIYASAAVLILFMLHKLVSI